MTIIALLALVSMRGHITEGQGPQRAIRLLTENREGRFDRTAWLVRCANALIDLGRRDALQAMAESRRIAGSRLVFEYDLDALARLAFEIPKSPGYPDLWTPNIMFKQLRPKFRKEARFPMIVFDDIPFQFTLGGSVSTGSRRQVDLQTYARYPMRTKHLRPPDDPFSSCQKLIASDLWPFPDHSRDDERFRGPYKENAGDAMRQVFSLVFDVYHPYDYRSEDDGNGLHIAKYRREFLKVGAHWDDRLQRYVRRDGIRLTQKSNPPPVNWTPPFFNGVNVLVTLQRAGISSDVQVKVEANSEGKGPWLPEVLRVIDAKTGRLIDWIEVVSQDDRPGDHSSESKFLKGPAERTGLWSRYGSRDLTIPSGTSVRLEVVTSNHVERGPVLKP